MELKEAEQKGRKNMNDELKKLLEQINAKKQEVKDYIAEDKILKAKMAKKELVEMQDKFNLLMDLEEEEEEEIKDHIRNGGGARMGEEKKPSVKEVAAAFVNRIVCGLKRIRMPEKDEKIMNAMSETSPEDGGFTVPEDVKTKIIELRRTSDDLEQYVNTEHVTTKSGSRVMEKDADSTPWEDVDEGAEFTEGNTPQFTTVKYEIKKKGGILKTTRELLQDTAENILGYLNKWIAKKSRATRNAAILKVMKDITDGKEVVIETFDDLKDVFNVTLDPAIAASSVVITNQSGYNYLDKLKDSQGKYILQPDVTDKTKTMLFGVYPVKKVSNKVLKNTEVKDGSDNVTAYKYPVYMGDMKEAITLFDREKITIELSTEAGDLWAKDLTGIKVRDRFDVVAFDKTAIVKGEITEKVAG